MTSVDIILILVIVAITEAAVSLFLGRAIEKNLRHESTRDMVAIDQSIKREKEEIEKTLKELQNRIVIMEAMYDTVAVELGKHQSNSAIKFTEIKDKVKALEDKRIQ